MEIPITNYKNEILFIKPKLVKIKNLNQIPFQSNYLGKYLMLLQIHYISIF